MIRTIHQIRRARTFRIRAISAANRMAAGRITRNLFILLFILGSMVCGLALGCDSPGEGVPQASTAPAPASAVPSAAAALSASAAPKVRAHALAGTWKGSYEAVKGTVVMPPKVAGKTWDDDDGKVMSGPGKITLVVADDGKVSGHGEGALGPANLNGEADEDTVRVTVTPVVPTADNAMTGVLVGQLKDEKLKGRVRVAGPAATIVRESPLVLEREE